MNAKQPYRTPEGDMCDLDPNKICDNCMKCVNKNGADYTEILAIEQLDIAPELMAEWEEKLRLAEEAEREGEAEAVEEELIEPIGYRGVRQRRAHVSHVQRRG